MCSRRLWSQHTPLNPCIPPCKSYVARTQWAPLHRGVSYVNARLPVRCKVCHTHCTHRERGCVRAGRKAVLHRQAGVVGHIRTRNRAEVPGGDELLRQRGHVPPCQTRTGYVRRILQEGAEGTPLLGRYARCVCTPYPTGRGAAHVRGGGVDRGLWSGDLRYEGPHRAAWGTSRGRGDRPAQARRGSVSKWKIDGKDHVACPRVIPQLAHA